MGAGWPSQGDAASVAVAEEVRAIDLQVLKKSGVVVGGLFEAEGTIDDAGGE